MALNSQMNATTLFNLEVQVSELRESVNWHTEYLKEQNKKINELVSALELFSDSLSPAEVRLDKSQAQELMNSLLSKATIIEKSWTIGDITNKMQENNEKFEKLFNDLASLKMNYMDIKDEYSLELTIEDFKSDLQKSYLEYYYLENSAAEIEPELLNHLNNLSPRKILFNPLLKSLRYQLVHGWCEQALKSLQLKWSLDSLVLISEFQPDILKLINQTKEEIEKIRKLKKDPEYVDTYMTGFYLKENKKEEFKSLFAIILHDSKEIREQAMLLQEKWPEILSRFQIQNISILEELIPSPQDKHIFEENKLIFEDIKKQTLEERTTWYKGLRSSWLELITIFNEYCVQLIQGERMVVTAGLPCKMFLLKQNTSLVFLPPENFYS